MSDRSFDLRQRRGELVARIDMQRGQLAEFASDWQGSFALADQGLSIARFLRTYPLLLAGLAVVVVWRKRRVAGLIRGGLLVWKGYRLATRYLQKL